MSYLATWLGMAGGNIIISWLMHDWSGTFACVFWSGLALYLHSLTHRRKPGSYAKPGTINDSGTTIN